MSLTQVFLTFRENLLEPQTTSMYGIVPSCGEPIPYRKSDLLSFKTDKPFYIADSFATPSNEEEDDITEYYAVLGTPSDFDCIFLLLDLTNGVVKGYDRRTKHVIEGHSYGMGSVIEGINPNTSLEDLSFAVSAWHEKVSSIPRETGGKTIPWDGRGYRPREFHFYVDLSDRKEDLDTLIENCKAEKILYIDFRKCGGRFELLHPGWTQLKKIISLGFQIYKDWDKVS